MAGHRDRWRRAGRSAAIVLSTGCAGLVASAAGAQTSSVTGTQALSASGSTFGPATREIAVTLSGEAQSDSNVARSSDAGAAARGIRKADVRFRPAVEANIVLPTGPAVLTLRGVAGYDFYARNGRLNRERIDLVGGAATRVAICDLSLQSGFARSQNDLADLSIVPGDIRASTVNVQTVTRVGGNVSCGAPVGLRPTAFVEYRHSDNSATLRQFSDFNALSYGGGVGYSSPAVGVVTVFVGRSKFDYPDRAATVLAGNSDFDLSYGGVRLDRRLGARLQFNGQVTYVDVDRGVAGGGSFNGLNWDIALTLRAGTRARLTLGTARQIDASSGFNARVTEVSSYTADISYALTNKVRLSVNGSHRQRDFDVVQVVTPAVLLQEDNIDQAQARISYIAGRRLTFDIGVGYQDRDADVAVYRYKSYRTSVGARLSL